MPLSRDADYAMYLYTCNRCRGFAVEPSPEQRSICPSYTHHGYFAYSGGGKGYLAQGMLEGKVKPSEEAAQVAMSCLDCGACTAACPPGFDLGAMIHDLRGHIVQAGFFANNSHRELLARMGRTGNPFGKRTAKIALPVFTGREEVLLWLGCRERFLGGALEATLKILEGAGVSFGVLADEPCCGAPLLMAGDQAGFAAAAAGALERLAAAGAERALFLCPHCAATVSLDYLEHGDLAVEPVTLPAFLAGLMAEGRIGLQAGEPATVAYHDPCRLARFLEDVDAPRELIAALGLTLVELDRNRQWTYCCGAGGWASEIVPDLARAAARERLLEVKPSGATRLVTACSYCASFLRRQARGGCKVTHLAEEVAARLTPG